MFIGVGIAAFYVAPKAPEYPPYPQKTQNASGSAEIGTQERTFQKNQEAFTKQNELYNRSVSIISLLSAVIILTGSIFFAQRLAMLADGLLLGSSLTLIYSIFRGFAAHDDMYRFLVVSVSLILVLFIGYIKFLRHQKY